MQRNTYRACLAAGLAVVGLSATTAQAQLRVGVVGGVNLARMSSDAPVGPLNLTEGDFLKARSRFGVGGVLKYAHYVHGLSDIDTTAAVQAKNRGIQLRVGVTFPIGR